MTRSHDARAIVQADHAKQIKALRDQVADLRAKFEQLEQRREFDRRNAAEAA